MARSYRRKEGQATFTASSQSRIELSRNYHNQYLTCELVINHTNTTAVFKSEAFANLINAIQIVANGNKTIKHVDAKKLAYNALIHKGRHMVTTTAAADGAQVSKLYFTIDFSMRGTARPVDTIENAALYTTFDMMIDWGAAASVGSGIVIDSAVLKVASHQLVGYSRNAGEKIAHFVETQSTEEITSSTSEYQINLPAKKVYTKLLIASLVDGDRSNDVINSIKLKSGTTIFAEWDADMLRADNIDKSGIETAADADGLLLLDLIGRGKLSDALDTRGNFNTLELVLNVSKQTGTNNIVVYQDVFDLEDAVEIKK